MSAVDKKPCDAVIRDRLETRGDRVTDLHLWQVGPAIRAAVISVLSDDPHAFGDLQAPPGRLARSQPRDDRG